MSLPIPLQDLEKTYFSTHASGMVVTAVPPLGGKLVQIDVELVRAANSNLYSSKTVINASGSTSTPKITGAASIPGGSGYITGVSVTCDLQTIGDTIRVHFYKSQITTLPADGSPFTRLYANRLVRSPHVDVGPLGTEGTGSDAAGASNTDIRIPFVCAAGSSDLYFALEAINGHLPKSGGKITVTFFIDQN